MIMNPLSLFKTSLTPFKLQVMGVIAIILLAVFGYWKLSTWWNENKIDNLKTQVAVQSTQINDLKKAMEETQQTVKILDEQRKRDEARSVEYRKQKGGIASNTSTGVDSILKTSPDKDGKIAPVLASTLNKIKAERGAPK